MTPSPPEANPESGTDVAASLAAIARVPIGAPITWLSKGLSDLYAAPTASLFYGVAFAVMGWAIVFFYGHAYSLTVALMAGFMLLGPGLAMGLYGLSRQREAGQVPRLQPSLSIWKANLSNLGIFALVTGVVLLVWARASLVVFAVFYSSGLPTASDFLRELLSFENVEFVTAYLIIGSGFAAFIFSISVVAVPLMLDRDKDAISAMLLSIATVAKNPLPMLLWACLIVMLAGIGFATAFTGLIVTIPILGHATWHAYRALVPPDAR
ncbi:MAG: DUF2189 domain-containing protein [Azonexus sp.]|jgi:uncharacterized membrane protein